MAADLYTPLSDSFTLFLLQVFVILLTCKVTSSLLTLLKLPSVVGEMMAGVILGPTVLGRIPGWLSVLFPSSSLGILSAVSSFGLCFFMFTIGLEMDMEKVRPGPLRSGPARLLQPPSSPLLALLSPR